MPNFIDMTGQTFGRLTVLERAEDIVSGSGHRFVAWRCKCVCSREKVARGTYLRRGLTESCGCLNSEQAREIWNEKRGGRPLGYESAHTRMRKIRGRASNHPCVDCASPAQQWSYNHEDPDELIAMVPAWDGPGETPLAYSLDFDHYEPRCIRCHTAFDKAHKRQMATKGSDQ